MCDWLSRHEWCDVRLLCGGRAFAAHRAVLASVSSFLRRLLLSCPIDETPTLIVLPDFDLEAMSAVLYYIYNGEVSMPKQRTEKFLDIIKAMQIFIDRQYLTQLCVSIGEIECNFTKFVPDEDRIFILRAENDRKPFVTFKKLFQHDISQRNARDEIDYSNFMQAPAQNWNEQFKPSLGNLQPSHGDRQRDYFLRDSFMETYPRNRNANGRAAGVPAITNGSYRSPTSPLLTNPNASGYPGTDDAFPSSAEETIDTATPAPRNFDLAINHLHNPYSANRVLAEMSKKLSTANMNDVWVRSEIVPTVSPVDAFQHSTETKRVSYLDLSFIQKASGSTAWYPSGKNLNVRDKIPCNSGDHKLHSRHANTKEMSRNKVAILNKALDNPWCPRLPNSFRPFRRKSYSLDMPYNKNDSNNNIKDKPTVSVKEEPSPESMDPLNNVNFPSSTVEDDKVQANNQFLSAVEPASRPTRYACSDCGKTFSQLRNFKYHMSVHRGTKEFAASCSVCGKCFNDRGYLSSHMKIHRNRKEYKCSQCPKSFNQRVAYNMHVRIHTGIKPHVCQQCGKAFSRKMLLKQHQRTHSGERPYACPHCDKRFADRSNMTLHLRLHSGIKPFKCPMCPKSFTKKHHLKSHVNFHTGAKPYSCPRCKLAFTQSSNMRTHLKRCTAPEPNRSEQSA